MADTPPPKSSKVQPAPKGMGGPVPATPPSTGGKTPAEPSMKIAASERIVIVPGASRKPVAGDGDIAIRDDDDSVPAMRPEHGDNGIYAQADNPVLKALQEKLDTLFPFSNPKNRAVAYYDSDKKLYRIRLPERISVKELEKLGLATDIVKALKPRADEWKWYVPASVLEKTLLAEGYKEAASWIRKPTSEPNRQSLIHAVRNQRIDENDWPRGGNDQPFAGATVDPFQIPNSKEIFFVIDHLAEGAPINALFHGDHKAMVKSGLSGPKMVEIRDIYIEKALGIQAERTRTV